MTYIPTTAELEEMGFTQTQTVGKDFIARIDADGRVRIDYNSFKHIWRISFSQFYPKSRQDIETLIRLFTKP